MEDLPTQVATMKRFLRNYTARHPTPLLFLLIAFLGLSTFAPHFWSIAFGIIVCVIAFTGYFIAGWQAIRASELEIQEVKVYVKGWTHEAKEPVETEK